ncbi:MAG: TetR/AcrR family transcriptional regulator [Pseudomonadota bacterium]
MGKNASRAARPVTKRAARAKKNRDYHLPPGVARQSLLQSAIRLLNERGMGNVSLNDVAREAKLNPALVTYYFGSKDNLFQAVVEQVVGEWRAEVIAAVPEDAGPEDTLRLRARATMHFLRRYPYLTRLIMHQMMTVKSKESRFFIENFARINFEEHTALLRKGAEAGIFRPVDPLFYFAHYVAIGDLYANLRPMMERLGGKAENDGARFEAFVEAMIEMLIYGIAAKPKKSAKLR